MLQLSPILKVKIGGSFFEEISWDFSLPGFAARLRRLLSAAKNSQNGDTVPGKYSGNGGGCVCVIPVAEAEAYALQKERRGFPGLENIF